MQEIFLTAVECHRPEEWQAYLDQACGADNELRHQVNLLLQAHQQAGSVPGAAVGEPDHTSAYQAQTERPGTVIGSYKLLQQIGEGGMGTVFMAEQTEPVHRKVALKIIKPGMDSRQVIARFEAERQALALMDHPNIAKVYDAGTTEGGRPYFIMELVKGVPITRYCDEHRLTPKKRLELFVPVCQAVQHAHQKGIIHRDLKPSNVLVAEYDDKPVTKVIDFGVAKATGPKLTDRTMFTEFGQVVGTLEFMSPEQAKLNALDIDTRSDIYALGVLLYELLTGTTPFEKKRLQQAAFDEMLRIIREEEPPKPSTRLSTAEELPSIAANRSLEPRKLSGLVRGELDWIVMRCLEKDRNRRYATANGLTHDIERYLHDEPVLACPPSAGYRLRKFARKHRTALRVAGAFVVLLVLAAAVSMWQAIRATLAEQRAWQEQQQALNAEQKALEERNRAEASFHMARDAIDRFFTQVSESPKLKAQPMEKFRKELLLNAKEFYERFIREQFDTPGVRYDLGLAYKRLGEVHRELGDFTAAEKSLTKAVALIDELVPAQPEAAEYERDLGACHAALALVYFDNGRMEKANAAFEQALAIQERQAGAYPEAAEYRYALAKTYRDFGFMQGRLDQMDNAAKRYEQALDILTKLVQDYPVAEHQLLLATTQTNLASVYTTNAWYDRAEPLLKEAQRIYGQLVRDQASALPEHWQSLGRCHAMLGMAYARQGQTEKAEAAEQEAVEIFEKLAKEHPDVLEYAYDVGRCYIELGLTASRAGRPDAAVARLDRAIAILESVLGRGLGAARNRLLTARLERAVAQAARGDHAQATAEAEAIASRTELNAGHLYDLACTFSQASAATDRDGKLSAAERARLKEHYADRAIVFLRQAIARRRVAQYHLKTDPDFDPLRAREDFRKLLTELEKKQMETGNRSQESQKKPMPN
jgi:serine/threonine protein kinase/tetratricopeptide (TPR) repeat protein